MNDSLLTSLRLLSPDLLLLSMMTVLILLVSFSKARQLGYIVTQSTLFAVFLLSSYLFKTTSSLTVLLSGQYAVDALALLSKTSIYGLSMLVLLYIHRALPAEIKRDDYYLLALLAVFGMSIMVSAYTFLTMYLGLELLSLSLYAMIALEKESSFAVEAAMKYFVLGSLASGFLLYGISLVFGLTSSIQMNTVFYAMTLGQNTAAIVALVFILGGLLFKLGAFPFHMWVPDVYEGATSSTTLFLSSVPKIAAFAILVRILTQALSLLYPVWVPVLMTVAILSMFFGNLLAMVQTRMKRLLAYSSIAHAGYVVLGLLAGPLTSTGYEAALFYMLTYALIVIGAFAVVALLNKAGVSDALEDYHGLSARHPWLALMLLVLMFSLAGIPPTVGFIAKFNLLQALLAANLPWLAGLALVFALMGVYYYIRVVMCMYFKPASPGALQYKIQPSFTTNAIIGANTSLVVLLGVFPNCLMAWCHIF